MVNLRERERESQRILMKDNNRQVISVGNVVLIKEGANIQLEDGVGRKTYLWNRWCSEESFQNMQGNMKTSKEAVPYWKY